MKASSWRVFPFFGGPQVGVPPRTPTNIFFIFLGKIWTPPNLNFMDLRRQNSTYEERTPPEGSNISIFTSCSKIMLPVRKSAHMEPGEPFWNSRSCRTCRNWITCRVCNICRTWWICRACRTYRSWRTHRNRKTCRTHRNSRKCMYNPQNPKNMQNMRTLRTFRTSKTCRTSRPCRTISNWRTIRCSKIC